jgi:hypothetical protein
MQVVSKDPVTQEQAAIFLETLAERSAEKFVLALRQNPFSDIARGKIFGIVPGDTTGEVIYRAWLEIYIRKLESRGESRKAPTPGPASSEFRDELAKALLEAKLAPVFKTMMEEVVADDKSQRENCQKLLQDKSRDWSFLIHPTDKVHCEFMERFRDKKV